MMNLICTSLFLKHKSERERTISKVTICDLLICLPIRLTEPAYAVCVQLATVGNSLTGTYLNTDKRTWLTNI